ncbi:MAG: ABC transporter ATP-binding protein [Candidatus Thorarchaeota archaeon]|nr:ABC transporter ATP-binding protein [Candidatus Thorarchaeota archaeon]
MSENALGINNVTKRFNSLIAIDSFSLDVKQGEVLGLLGPNGAGKSTLTNMICGLLPPDEGTISVCGLDVKKERKQVKQKLGVVPQDIVLYDYMTAIENIKFFGVMNGYVGQHLKQRIDEMIDYMGLDAAALNRRTKLLSGGMRRRVNIACGILHDPDIILLDEPTAGLDPQNRFELWRLIEKMNSEGKTIVLTTHLMDEAQELCNRVAIIDHGKLIALDTPRALIEQVDVQEAVLILLTDPKPEYSALFEKVNSVANVTQVELPETHEIAFRLLVDDADKVLPDIVKAASTIQGGIRSIEVSSPTLSDVFLEITGRTLAEAQLESETAISQEGGA